MKYLGLLGASTSPQATNFDHRLDGAAVPAPAVAVVPGGPGSESLRREDGASALGVGGGIEKGVRRVGTVAVAEVVLVDLPEAQTATGVARYARAVQEKWQKPLRDKYDQARYYVEKIKEQKTQRQLTNTKTRRKQCTACHYDRRPGSGC